MHPANHAAFDHRSRVDQKVDAFVQFFGSLKFIGYMSILIVFWIAFNVLELTGNWHFDKYPFILLNLLFSTQASYAAPLILLSQNRQGEIDRLKAEHDYVINQEARDLSQAGLDAVNELKELLSNVHQAP